MPIDPLVKALTLEHVSQDICDFQRLLQEQVDEQVIHEFLSRRSYFFNGIIRLFGVSPLYSKVKLGSNYQVDFACFDSGSVGPEWRLVEIESPKGSLFTKMGDPTARLTHALRQVHDWQIWIHENIEYARNIFPHIDYPLCYIFIGRRCELTGQSARRLKRMNYEYRRSVEVHSFDWFISSARSVEKLLEDHPAPQWRFPLHALSHEELSKGLPPEAQEYMTAFFASPGARLYPQEFLRERNGKFLSVDDEDIV